MHKFLLVAITILYLLFLKEDVYAANFLLNSSFEENSGGIPNSWTKNVSTATMSASPTANTGSASLSINKLNGTTGSIYAYQDADVEADSYYSLSGYAVKNSSNFAWVVLRISWRNSSSSEISKTDSSQLTTDSTSFQPVKIESVQAPSSATKARIELVGNITTANPSSPLLFDDIEFSQILPPEQPTSTPPIVSTATPTSVQQTLTQTPTPTATVTPKAAKVTEASQGGTPPLILGVQEATSTGTSSAVESEETQNGPKTENYIAGALLVSGTSLLGIAAFSFWRKLQ